MVGGGELEKRVTYVFQFVGLRTAESEGGISDHINSQMILHLLSNNFPYGVGSKVELKDKAAGRRGV